MTELAGLGDSGDPFDVNNLSGAEALDDFAAPLSTPAGGGEFANRASQSIISDDASIATPVGMPSPESDGRLSGAAPDDVNYEDEEECAPPIVLAKLKLMGEDYAILAPLDEEATFQSEIKWNIPKRMRVPVKPGKVTAGRRSSIITAI